jgi:putative ABC transport system permease protein
MMWVLARRELRGSVRAFRIVLACLALGVAAIAAVGSLRAGIDRGLATDGRRILGGDLDIQGGAEPLPDTLRAWLQARGARTSDVVTMRSMLLAGDGQRQLVELKAVDPAYPLVGTLQTAPAQARGLVVEQLVLDRLGVHVGDTVRLGEASLPIAGVLLQEPDRVSGVSVLGPQAIIPLAVLPATGLVQPGSFVDYAMRAALPPGASIAGTIRALRQAFPDTGWRIRDPSQAAPGVDRFIAQVSLFLTLVGLSALLVGGIGVATGVRAWLEARARSIAILRCLGASSRLIFGVYLLQVMVLAGLGVLAGLMVGAALPALAGHYLSDVLPVPPRAGIYPVPLLLAAAYGLLTAACFALWPLGRAARISGGALFRDALLPDGVAVGRGVLATNALLAVLLVGLTIATVPERGFALWFCAAAAGTIALFRLGGWLLVRLAALTTAPRGAALRLGIGNLHRPGTAAPLMLLSLGLGLSTLAAVALIEGNIRHQIADQVPADAPSFYFIDIQNPQLPQFLKLVGGLPGVSDVHQVPSLRARIVSVNGVPADQVRATPQTRWALRGDRGLTYSATPPEGSRVVAGSWWPADYDGPPLVSLDANLARGWGVTLGETIVVNVLGRDIPLKVTSLRDIAWRTLSLNFVLVASPGLLEHAPHMHIATLRVPPAEEGMVLRRVTDALPNVTGIRVSEVLAAIAGLLAQLGAALLASGSVTLVAGALVLAGSVAAGQRRRIRDAVVLKSLGATRAQIRAAWLVEFGAIGLAAGVLAALVGTAASWGVMRFLLDAPWSFLPGVLAVTVLGCVLLLLGFGYLGTAHALRVPAAPLLRNE